MLAIPMFLIRNLLCKLRRITAECYKKQASGLAKRGGKPKEKLAREPIVLQHHHQPGAPG
ncbi:hypothetical protein DWV07_17005 [Dickeya zeae]|nr:hypothetical protein DWV07_17005 [Dickeya zeae]